MTIKPHKVIIVIPCYNEECGIADVIHSFPKQALRHSGFETEIVVIDNNSTDRTGEIARSLGATVLHEPKKGKGNAIRTGFKYVINSDWCDYVVMLDGDNTYHSSEILRLLEPLRSKFSNVVIGSRLGGKILMGSMKMTNRIGNRIFSRLVRTFYGVHVTDVLTGYFAWEFSALEKLRPHLKSQGFAIEMEMVTKMAHLGLEICSVPISYSARAGETNLNPFKDGIRIFWMFFKNLFWKPRPQFQQQPRLRQQPILNNK
ncbi:MAG TPA: glycosyltransferase family 2 protein [Candidatus Paceibacterota bacterium]|jgi:dolichol-phosphate mannosyltransferase|nr:glycosyltransferase family 2 protein [Candidatus Paceibacterota bacterium]